MDKTLRKGLQLVEALASSNTPRGAAELGRELALTRSNVSRLLGTLAILGYVRRADDAGRYVATLKTWEIGMRIMRRDPLRRTAQPFLRALHAEVGLNVFLSVLEGGDVLYIDKVEAETISHVSAQPGMRLPAFLVSSGHAMLAWHEPSTVAARVQVHPRADGLDMTALGADLFLTRERGFAMTVDGSRQGVVSLSAPILVDGYPIAAVAISGPKNEVTEARRQVLVSALRNAAARISETLSDLGQVDYGETAGKAMGWSG
ncbi:IclR family transcriptional regulator [Mesorhizobium sp. M4A.F.Ca.ET.020.02.1.1]|uniref:IclR family transcriptional regulator n=1 Tax=unclassified Mesorhizobium TaxID=325217 RepID=UPI000FD48BF9|nr:MULTISPECIES: IclR family transcriptional regulator [unclassified Mesorhizobium]RVD33719.1 IclR family transcriptional regulator [Mesorhizobium sp. M4A.F.Ca.ET.020.02.1.1]RWC08506.1 MAG: IclR family transcriptional regulator [Mesorhizobium sp.]